MRIRGLLSIVAAIALLSATFAPREAQAFFTGQSIASTDAYLNCVKNGPGFFSCEEWRDIVDPPAVGVTDVTMSFQFNSALYTFNAAASGPLGVFSVGGDAPPAHPGTGTQPLQLLPASGFNPGSALPGSTLTYTDVAGLLTVHYHLSSPITAANDVNFFVLTFNFVNPVTIDPAASTVTYVPTGPGGDLSQTSFACTTTDGANACGSDTPGAGVTFHLAVVPEPASLALLGVGFAGLGAFRRHHGTTV